MAFAVGRIFLRRYLAGAFGHHEDRTPYEATREDAMATFAKRREWQTGLNARIGLTSNPALLS